MRTANLTRRNAYALQPPARCGLMPAFEPLRSASGSSTSSPAGVGSDVARAARVALHPRFTVDELLTRAYTYPVRDARRVSRLKSRRCTGFARVLHNRPRSTFVVVKPKVRFSGVDFLPFALQGCLPSTVLILAGDATAALF